MRNKVRGVSHLQVVIFENMRHISREMHPKVGCQFSRRAIKLSSKSSETK